MTLYSRRQIIKMIGVSAAAGAAWKLGFSGQNSPLIEIAESRVLMGTVVNLTVIGEDESIAKTAVSATLDHMAHLETILSCHRPDSELSILNREGALQNASQPLLDVTAQAQQISGISSGAFDITIKPLVDLYQANHAQGEMPTETAVYTTQQLVNYKNIIIEGKNIHFAKPGMSITLDGIGKGYIVDAGTAVLRKHGFKNVMVEAGGDLMALGAKDNNQPWRIGLQPPRPQAEANMTVIGLRNQAAATSGDYMQPFTAELSQHHIIDPRTGYSAPELASVTITAPSAMLADGLATAVAVLGSKEGLELINQLSLVKAYLVTKEMKQIFSINSSI
ncbi:FAD:protein FMN transferase [Candidatus Leptofilum sp.]|uniref:FAD:protein FMN transferase n=1 Tax=Candidatus Leptofilum sp. TaxID=3241576 RepID=UPI003B58B78C